jgi:hypothetical protein
LTVELIVILNCGKLSPKLTVDSTEVAYIIVLSCVVPNTSVLDIVSGYAMNIVFGDPKEIVESIA